MQQTVEPSHVAIIMDGNGRWAEQRGLSRLDGHRAGTDNINRIVRSFLDYGVQYLTLFTFSTENWSRPTQEVHGIFQLLGDVIDRETENLCRDGVQVTHLGTMAGLTNTLQGKIKRAIDLTQHNTRMTLGLAFNYGGRADIINAVRRMVTEGIPPEQINEATFSQYLCTNHMPDPDLIIRTGGEMRLSNFLIWQAAYSEYYATTVLWPDFDEKDISAALAAYSHRNRRFGGLKPRNGRDLKEQVYPKESLGVLGTPQHLNW